GVKRSPPIAAGCCSEYRMSSFYTGKGKEPKHMPISFSRLFKGLSLLALMMLALSGLVFLGARAAGASSLSDSLAQANANAGAQLSSPFTFSMVPSPNIKACLPKATGTVTITPSSLNDLMKVSVSGLAPSTGYDLFVIQLPN